MCESEQNGRKGGGGGGGGITGAQVRVHLPLDPNGKKMKQDQHYKKSVFRAKRCPPSSISNIQSYMSPLKTKSRSPKSNQIKDMFQ